MKHAFIMDPLEGVKPHKDTTYFLMLAACERGHEVFFVDPATLSLQHSDVYATVVKIKVSRDQQQPFVVESKGSHALGTMDAVWIRQDPPFDRSYFYVTLLYWINCPTESRLSTDRSQSVTGTKNSLHCAIQCSRRLLSSPESAQEISEFLEEQEADHRETG